MYKLPDESTATPNGAINIAFVADPPSPEYPEVPPVPATVEMMPWGVTFRTTALLESAMYRLPEESTARPAGWFTCALVAAPPSPENPGIPVPAKVVMIPA